MISYKIKKNITRVMFYIAVLVYVAFFLFPLYAAVKGALTPYERLGTRAIFPETFHYKNFIDIWHFVPLARYLLNSLIYVVGVCAIVLPIAVLAGYSISRFRFWGRETYSFTILLSQMLPLTILIIPLFMVVKTFGLVDSYLSVIIVTSAFGLPLPIWLLSNYFQGIPKELDEAAMIDGCGRARALFSVVVPAATPGIFSVLIITMSLAWGQFLVPLVFLPSAEQNLPVTVAIFRLYGAYEIRWNLIMAAVVVSIIPPLFLYWLMQRYVTGGWSLGAVKG